MSIYRRGDRAAEAETTITPKRWRLAARESIYQRGDLPPLRAPAGKAETEFDLVESLSQTMIWDEYLP